MNVVSFDLDFNNRYNFWSGITGGFFLALAYFGTDQSQVQRYLSGRSVTESRLGLLFNGMFKVPMQFVILFIGVMVFVFYLFARPPIFFNAPALRAGRRRPARRGARRARAALRRRVRRAARRGGGLRRGRPASARDAGAETSCARPPAAHAGDARRGQGPREARRPRRRDQGRRLRLPQLRPALRPERAWSGS